MKTLDKIKGEIDRIIKSDRELVKAGEAFTVEFMANSILSIPISKGGECPECGGSKQVPGGKDPFYSVPCPKCGALGILPDITVRDAIERINKEKMVDTESALRLIGEEHARAVDKFGKFHNAHEGWGVLREEYLELEAEIMRKHRDVDAMRKEAIQVGAMAMRFIIDVT